ncbi:autotransporter-associated beta strand repeat-containing protein [Roseimicrobium sp. ORNL1]|uniref:beta strand repeat-containing protein n=1 Tax=Roseimicrobium sp. ORNL1 TaxID=2711231 RepID=UPI0013E11395|nr:autotransporter-associated beta strand repeat-containing protein [Roseimicrobium sp. ORNL1]QIF03267.1 PEP-CTERM sorting domain-containing protein [Roseimicrobium sp. ORNL1]
MSLLPVTSEAQTTQTWLNAGVSNDWSTIAPNWDAAVPWTNGNDASFAGAFETVDIAGTVTVNSILFGTTGWTIADSNADGTLSLVGQGRITTSAGTSTISENIAGGNLIKGGAGTLVLSAANTYTGTTTVEMGTLQINNGAALGGTSNVTVLAAVAPDPGGSVALNNVTVSGVSITINGAGSGDSMGALKASGAGTSVWTGNVTIGSAGTRVGASTATSVLEISGAIDSGGVAHGLSIRGNNDGGTVLLSNTNNTYLGKTTIIGGVLKVGVDDALPTGTLVELGNSQGQISNPKLDLNGFNQRVAGVTAVVNNNVDTWVTNTSGTASVLTVENAAAVEANVFITGNLSLVKEGTGTFSLTRGNTYLGSTTVNAGTLEISGLLGTASGQEFILNGGTLSINNNSAVGANNSDRISNTANFTFRGGSFVFTGTADAGVNSSENINGIILNRGYQTARVSFGGTNVSTFTASGITRSAGGGVVFLTGTNLGANSTSTSSISRFFVTNAPTLIGTTDALDTGINAAAKNTKIVAYLLGSTGANTGETGTQSTTANTFVTYNANTGFRPLNLTDEFTQNSFVTGTNTRITTNNQLNMTTSTVINSLIMEDPATAGTTILNISSGQTLSVTSGAILFTGSTSTIQGGTVAFGAQEAILHVNASSNSTITSVITGSGGLTVAGTGLLVLSGANTYTGDTTLLSGTTVFTANSAGSPGAVTSGPLGRGNLVFAGGAIRTNVAAGTRTIGNNIIFKADTTIASGGAAVGHINFSGGVTLTEGDRVLTNNALNTTTFSGAIGEDGQKRGLTVTTAATGTGAVIFTGTNTYTGETKVTGLATLMMNGTHNTGSSYSVASGATLTGGGTIGVAAGGNVTIGSGGTLSVGDGTANAADLAITTTAGGTLVFADSSSILRLDLISDSSSGAGNASDMSGDATRADRLVVSGNTNLNGVHLILGSAVDATTFSAGDRWKIFDWVTAFPTGAFTINPATDLPTLGVGLKWDYSDLYTGGTIAVTVVPEPSRAVLLMGGVMVGLLQRRRRRN